MREVLFPDGCPCRDAVRAAAFCLLWLAEVLAILIPVTLPFWAFEDAPETSGLEGRRELVADTRGGGE